jgi:fatty-acid peroxygenase
MELLTGDNLQGLVELFRADWRTRASTWQRTATLRLHSEAEKILCQAVCAWAGVPAAREVIDRRARSFAAMIEGSGALGPRLAAGLWHRARTERWVRGVIAKVRAGRLSPRPRSPLERLLRHRDADGQPLDTPEAAVELINLLRPVVAVARFITFSALALHEHPSWRERLREAPDAELESFAQEVRRFYPFFPAIGGIALQDFEWRDLRIARGTWVMLDLYGTNHDPRHWREPDVFRPERFRGWNGNPFSFVAQGGGAPESGHRCPGERLTIELVKAALCMLCEMRYEVPSQDLRVDLARIPALPASGFLIRNAIL